MHWIYYNLALSHRYIENVWSGDANCFTRVLFCFCFYFWAAKQRGKSWWRDQMETFSALLVLCARNSPVTAEFHAKSPVTRSWDIFFDLRLNNRLSKHSWDWWFETPSRSLWRNCNEIVKWKRTRRGVDLPKFTIWQVCCTYIHLLYPYRSIFFT